MLLARHRRIFYFPNLLPNANQILGSRERETTKELEDRFGRTTRALHTPPCFLAAAYRRYWQYPILLQAVEFLSLGDLEITCGIGSPISRHHQRRILYRPMMSKKTTVVEGSKQSVAILFMDLVYSTKRGSNLLLGWGWWGMHILGRRYSIGHESSLIQPNPIYDKSTWSMLNSLMSYEVRDLIFFQDKWVKISQ